MEREGSREWCVGGLERWGQVFPGGGKAGWQELGTTGKVKACKR
jgi:hypothetical protein